MSTSWAPSFRWCLHKGLTEQLQGHPGRGRYVPPSEQHGALAGGLHATLCKRLFTRDDLRPRARDRRRTGGVPVLGFIVVCRLWSGRALLVRSGAQEQMGYSHRLPSSELASSRCQFGNGSQQPGLGRDAGSEVSLPAIAAESQVAMSQVKAGSLVELWSDVPVRFACRVRR